MKTKIKFLTLLAAFVMFASTVASAQNMSGTVKTANVRFAAGKNQTTLRGTAAYGMSYVYNFKVRKGQTVSIKATTKEPDLTFSVFSPVADSDPLAFGTQEWTGVTEEDGTYSITLVMNNEQAKRVPYSLLIKIQ